MTFTKSLTFQKIFQMFSNRIKKRVLSHLKARFLFNLLPYHIKINVLVILTTIQKIYEIFLLSCCHSGLLRKIISEIFFAMLFLSLSSQRQCAFFFLFKSLMSNCLIVSVVTSLRDTEGLGWRVMRILSLPHFCTWNDILIGWQKMYKIYNQQRPFPFF